MQLHDILLDTSEQVNVGGNPMGVSSSTNEMLYGPLYGCNICQIIADVGHGWLGLVYWASVDWLWRCLRKWLLKSE
jgi:hypothetical protein